MSNDKRRQRRPTKRENATGLKSSHSYESRLCWLTWHLGSSPALCFSLEERRGQHDQLLQPNAPAKTQASSIPIGECVQSSTQRASRPGHGRAAVREFPLEATSKWHLIKKAEWLRRSKESGHLGSNLGSLRSWTRCWFFFRVSISLMYKPGHSYELVKSHFNRQDFNFGLWDQKSLFYLG